MKQPLTYEVEYWFLNMHPIESYDFRIQKVIATTPEEALKAIKKSAPKGSKGFKIVNYDR
tara:strand:- start:881 stop:1060 length:180 start_codon:yes stop_codon:yes gene_type:complete